MNLVLAYEPGAVALRQCGFLWSCRCADLGLHGCVAVVRSNESGKKHTSCPRGPMGSRRDSEPTEVQTMAQTERQQMR